MQREYPKSICDCCGEEVFQRSLNLKILSSLGQFVDPGATIDLYAAQLSKLANVPFAVALDWSKHGLFEKCDEKVGNCPECGHVLKTWRAEYCLSCKASWRDEKTT